MQGQGYLEFPKNDIDPRPMQGNKNEAMKSNYLKTYIGVEPLLGIPVITLINS